MESNVVVCGVRLQQRNVYWVETITSTSRPYQREIPMQRIY